MAVVRADADCEFPSLLPDAPLIGSEAFHSVVDNQRIVLEGQVRTIPGAHGNAFLVRGDEHGPEVLVHSPHPIDMTAHDGKVIRLAGTPDTSTSGVAKMLLMSGDLPVLLCGHSGHIRALQFRGKGADEESKYFDVPTKYDDRPLCCGWE